MRDVGLTVDYDGKRNIAYLNGEAIEYPIGAMMCEYARLSPIGAHEWQVLQHEDQASSRQTAMAGHLRSHHLAHAGQQA